MGGGGVGGGGGEKFHNEGAAIPNVLFRMLSLNLGT